MNAAATAAQRNTKSETQFMQFKHLNHTKIFIYFGKHFQINEAYYSIEHEASNISPFDVFSFHFGICWHFIWMLSFSLFVYLFWIYELKEMELRAIGKHKWNENIDFGVFFICYAQKIQTAWRARR